MLTHQPSGRGGRSPRQSGDPDYIIGADRPGDDLGLALDPGVDDVDDDDDDDDDDDEDDEFWADDLLGEVG